MNLTFVNDSAIPNSRVWFVYYGLDPATGQPKHLDSTGKLVPNVPAEKATAALAIQVSEATSIAFPMLNAARLYVSFEAPLSLTVDAAGNPIPPSPADPNDVNYGTPWDFFEVTYLPSGADGLFNLNLSNVQSANVPLAFQVAGADPSTRQPVNYTRGWLPKQFSTFLDALRGNPDFAGLVLPGSGRVLAPGTAITAFAQGVIKKPVFSATYLDKYIASVWSKFEREDLTFVGDPPPHSNQFVTWTGRVKNGLFTFTTTDLPGLVPIVLSVPSSADLFENNFNFCVSGGGEPKSLQQNYALQLFGTLCAAFNRSMMLTTTKFANAPNCAWCQAVSSFYQDPTTNHYSKQVHATCVGGLAYAFQSDDHCDVSSYVSVINPTGVTLTFVDAG